MSMIENVKRNGLCLYGRMCRPTGDVRSRNDSVRRVNHEMVAEEVALKSEKKTVANESGNGSENVVSARSVHSCERQFIVSTVRKMECL